MSSLTTSSERPVGPPVTMRAAYVLGWCRGYGYVEYATAMPPLAGKFLFAFEEGIQSGRLDRELDEREANT